MYRVILLLFMEEIFSNLGIVFKGYLDLEQYAKFMGTKIYNCGIHSYVDAYERKNIESLNNFLHK